MNTQEWYLVTYTILTQMSVGAFLVLGVVHFFVSRKTGEVEADRMSDRVLVAIIVTLGLGMLASLFHLGNLLNAPKAVTNFATSWLSREILLGVIFAVIGLVFVVLQWFKVGSASLRNVVGWIAALVGVILIYVQARVYMLSTQPSWNTFFTPTTFYTTTLLLGVLAVGAALVVNYAYVRRKEPDCADVQCRLMREALRWVAVAAVLLLGVELVVLPIYLATLASGSPTGLASVKLMAGSFGWVLVLRVILAFVGAGMLAMFLYQNALSPGHEKMLGNLAYAAFIVVLTAEVLGRALFYFVKVRIGI